MAALRNAVILCDYGDIVGGAEKVAIASALGLARRGVNVTYLAGCGPAAETFADSGVTVRTVFEQNPFDWMPKEKALANTVRSKPSEAAVRDVLGSLDPRSTVVHAHSFLAVLSSAAVGTALDLGFRTAMTCHDYGLSCPSQVQYDFRRKAICEVPGLGFRCLTRNCTQKTYVSKARLIARGTYLARVARLPQRLRWIVTISDLSERVLQPTFATGAHVTRIPNPIEVAKEARVPAERGAMLAYVGRLVEEKDPLLFAEAARRAKAPALFIVDGPLADRLRREYPECEVTGWLAPAEVKERLAAARALVLPSRWYENSPLVVFEALGQGLPVVVADTCAAREYVESGVTGSVFPSGDANALATTLAEYADDATVSARSRLAYDRYWSDPPTPERHVGRLLELYERMLA
ncbi:MAG: glycosyltransferase family 4 protein [Nitrospirae bacterium]|nr:glycosyltransferase family 4 protein [Fimbriimonadaceae bacterium]